MKNETFQRPAQIGIGSVLLIVLMLPAGRGALAQEVSSSEFQTIEEAYRQAYEKAYTLVLDEKWTEAATAFNKIRNQPIGAGQVKDDAAFWYCYSREKQGITSKEAFACYDAFTSEYRASNWVDDAVAATARIGKALGSSGDVRYAERVTQLQKSMDDQIAVTAIYALAQPGHDEVIPALVDAAETSEKEIVKVAVVRALDRVGTPAAREVLAHFARDGANGQVQAEAVIGLAEPQLDSAIPLLQQVLRTSPHLRARQAAVQGLHRIGTAGANQALVQALGTEKDTNLQQVIISALGDQRNGSAVTALAEVLHATRDVQVGRNALHALYKVDTQNAWQEIGTAIRESTIPGVRQEAAMMLARGMGDAAVPILVQVATSDPDHDVRQGAVQALGQINSPAARQGLSEVLRSSVALP